MKKSWILLAAGALLVVAACGDSDDGAATLPPPTQEPSTTVPDLAASLTGRTFLADALPGRDIVPDTTIRLSFAADGLGVHAGCNSMGGGWSIDDGVLVVGDMFTTEMACDPARMEQDAWIAEFVQGRPVVTLSGERLLLERSDGAEVLELLDRRVADPDRPLVGTRWDVDTLLVRDAAMTIPIDTAAALVFAEDGRVLVEAGCNTGSASYEFDAATGQVTFGPLALTRMACEEPAMELEAAVTALFDQEVEVEIEAARLWLRGESSGLGLVAAE